MNEIITDRIAEIVEKTILGIKPFTFAAVDRGQTALLKNGYRIQFGPASVGRRRTAGINDSLFIARDITVAFTWENVVRDANAKAELVDKQNRVNQFNQLIKAIDSDEKILEAAKNFNFTGDSGIIEGEELFILEVTFNLEL